MISTKATTKPDLKKIDTVILPVYNEDNDFPGTLLESDDLDVLCALEAANKLPEAHDIQLLQTPFSPYSAILLVGFGDKAQVTAHTVRSAAGPAMNALTANKSKSILFITDEAACPALFLEGLILKAFQNTEFKSERASNGQIGTFTAYARKGVKRLKHLMEAARIKAESANWARQLACCPGNHLTPSILAGKALAMAETCDLKTEILTEAHMRKLHMGGILAVSRGSEEDARLIILSYTHPKASQTLALVGKGLTFDAGGISLKKPQGMENMKYDMCGGAAVLGAMRAISHLKPAINVVALVPSSENLPSGKALKPGDVITAYSGKTIEIISTDAEGRLILADALAYAIKRYNPDKMVDIATLTGAVTTALGNSISAVMSNNAELSSELIAAGNATHERLWELPLMDEYEKDLESQTADIKNSSDKGAGTITGGIFLQNFVSDTAWAHLDIAGTANGMRHVKYLDEKHPSGFGTRLLTEWVLMNQ